MGISIGDGDSVMALKDVKRESWTLRRIINNADTKAPKSA
jgi:hypothetical protein